MRRQQPYLMIEPPDDSATVDFVGTASKRKKDRRACTVKLKVENGYLLITVQGCDDHATILMNESVELPEEDRRR